MWSAFRSESEAPRYSPDRVLISMTMSWFSGTWARSWLAGIYSSNVRVRPSTDIRSKRCFTAARLDPWS